MAKRNRKTISLALQGGGAHGAFTWGVLDRLCDEPELDIKAISATSAGAMNAAAFAAGFAKDGRAGAKKSLAQFWHAVSVKGMPYAGLTLTESAFQHFPFSPFQAAMAMTAFASPYEFNPFDVNPLRDLLNETIDFDAIHKSPIELFVSATNVETGRVKIFNDGEISREAILASACLPQTFRAIEIDGAAYWDGGYMGNPSLFPLIYSGAPQDVLMVLLNPISRLGVPKKVAEINDRINEISFNASLIGELRAIAFVQRLLDDGMLKEPIMKKYRRLNIHAVRGGQKLLDLSLHTKYTTTWPFLQNLRDKGFQTADDWLRTCSHYVGTGESSLDLRGEFLEG